MTLTETTNTEPLLRQGVFVRIASFAHRRRWLVLTLWVAVLFSVWTAVSVTCDDYRNSFARPAPRRSRRAAYRPSTAPPASGA